MDAAVCRGVSHTQYTLVQTALLANVHYNESLVWFEASCFCYTNTRMSLRLLSHGDLAALVLQDQTLHTLQELIDRVDGWVDQLKVLDLGISGS